MVVCCHIANSALNFINSLLCNPQFRQFAAFDLSISQILDLKSPLAIHIANSTVNFVNWLLCNPQFANSLLSYSILHVQFLNYLCFRFDSSSAEFRSVLYRARGILVVWKFYMLQMNNLGFGFPCTEFHLMQNPKLFTVFPSAKVLKLKHVVCSNYQSRRAVSPSENAIVKKENVKQTGKREHHLWMKKDSAGSGQKALNLVRIVTEAPNEKEAVYGALDKWTAWEVEFPLIAAAKALRILQKRSQWLRVLQVGKWMLSKGQGLTMGTYDILLLAFDMEKRVDEAESLWNMILHTHTRSISKRLFSRMVSLYDHHNMPNKIIEVFADMEELGVKPDEDTVRKVARAFSKLGDEDRHKMVLKKYLGKWKYIHFNGERVRVRRQLFGQEVSE